MQVKKFALTGIVALALVAGAGGAFAAVPAPTTPAHNVEATHGEAEGPVDPTKEEMKGALGTLVVTIVIFLCLAGVLRFTAWKPIMAGLKSREQAIRDSIEAAKKAKEDADRTTAELEAKMAEVQRQAAQALTQAKADAIKLADGIRSQAETESAVLKDRTLREIDAAKQQALSDINSHAAELGTAVARKILQREINPGDQQRLVDESLAELAKKN